MARESDSPSARCMAAERRCWVFGRSGRRSSCSSSASTRLSRYAAWVVGRYSHPPLGLRRSLCYDAGGPILTHFLSHTHSSHPLCSLTPLTKLSLSLATGGVCGRPAQRRLAQNDAGLHGRHSGVDLYRRHLCAVRHARTANSGAIPPSSVTLWPSTALYPPRTGLLNRCGVPLRYTGGGAGLTRRARAAKCKQQNENNLARRAPRVDRQPNASACGIDARWRRKVAVTCILKPAQRNTLAA
jgi:hypothetical protein